MAIWTRGSSWPGLPQERTPLNPLVPRPTLLLQGFSPWDPIAGTDPHSLGAFAAAGPAGRGLRLPANTDLGLTNEPHRFLSATGGSALVVLSREGAAQSSNAFAVSTTGNAATRFSAHLPWSDGNVYWDFGGTGGANRLAAATGIQAQRPHAFVLTAGPAGMRIFRDGLLLATSAGVPTRANPADSRRFGLGVHFDPHIGWSPDTGATYYLAAFWDRQLDEETARALSQDPALLYEPQQIWVRAPVAAAPGPGTRALVATAVGAAALSRLALLRVSLATSVGAFPGVARHVVMHLSMPSTASPVAGMTFGVATQRALSAVGVGAVSMGLVSTRRLPLPAVASGLAALGARLTWARALPALAAGVSTLTAGGPGARVLAVTAAGTATLGMALFYRRPMPTAAGVLPGMARHAVHHLSMPAAAVGAAALARGSARLLAATAIAVAGLAATRIAGVAGVSLVATAVGAATLGRRQFLSAALPATTAPVPGVERAARHHLALGAAGAGGGGLVRQVRGANMPRIVRVEWSLAQRSVSWPMATRWVDWVIEGGG